MVVQRAIVRGTILNLVQTRNMFTAQLTVTGGDTADMLWDTYLSSVISPLTPYLMNTVSFTSREIQELNQGIWQTVFDDPISYVGQSSTQDQLPNAVAFVFIAKTLVQRVVGRKFFSGLSEQWSNGNQVVGAAIAALASSLAAYLGPWTSLGGSTFAPGVVDRSGVFQAFTGGFVSTFLGSQRRRKPGVGM